MKKTLLIFALLMAIGLAQAQNANMDFIPFHYPGYEIFQFDNQPMQQRDGNIIANVCIGVPDDVNNSITVLGSTFYKVSPTNLQIIDSLFVADPWPAWYLFAQDPRGEGNIRANIEPDDNGGTALRISHFSDNDMTINHDEDVVVHLHDSSTYGCMDGYMMDSQGDLILKFFSDTPDGTFFWHIARCGVDGTVKHITDLSPTQSYIEFETMMCEFERSPKSYYRWKVQGGDLYVHYLDSNFQVTKQNIVNGLLNHHFYGDSTCMEVWTAFVFGNGNYNSTFVIPDEEDLFVVAPYTYDSGWIYEYKETGAIIARYNRNNMHMKSIVRINDQPGPETPVRVMSFQQTGDGDFYLVYRENTPPPKEMPTMTAVKLDHDLNVIWSRYCYEPQLLAVDPCLLSYTCKLYDDYGGEAGIYIVGQSYRPEFKDRGIFFFFLTEEGLAVGENGVQVRPYIYYPNPAQDQLHLHYSPDVTPAQIELYDLQGRLVKTQRSGLENLNLQDFSAGTYTMRVTLEGGKVFSDKVVKE